MNYEDRYAPISDRILSRVEYDTNGGCWLWSGGLNHDGYPTTKYRMATVRLHRESYRAFNGDPGNMMVLHKCDIRACVNPDHLFLGTHLDNMLDMAAKGRASKTNRPLSDHEKSVIESCLSEGNSIRSIARSLGRDHAVVMNWMRRAGLKRPEQPQRVMKKTFLELMDDALVHGSMGFDDLARHLYPEERSWVRPVGGGPPGCYAVLSAAIIRGGFPLEKRASRAESIVHPRVSLAASTKEG